MRFWYAADTLRTMPEQRESPFGPDSASVPAHLTILQGIIGRMAGNSTSCKIQCVVLVAGIIVLVAQTNTPGYALLAFVPTCLFFCLDVYYLSLDIRFRKSYNDFVCKLHKDEIVLKDLYVVRPDSTPMRRGLPSRLRSTAVWPFYGALALMILLVWQFNCIKTLLGF